MGLKTVSRHVPLEHTLSASGNPLSCPAHQRAGYKYREPENANSLRLAASRLKLISRGQHGNTDSARKRINQTNGGQDERGDPCPAHHRAVLINEGSRRQILFCPGSWLAHHLSKKGARGLKTTD